MAEFATFQPRLSITITDWIDQDGNRGAYAVAMPTRTFTHERERCLDDWMDAWMINDRITPDRTNDTLHIEGRDARSIWVKDLSTLGDAIRDLWADLFEQTATAPQQKEVGDGRRAVGSGTE